MAEFSGPVEAKNALLDYLYDREEAVPDDVREALRELLKEVSPVKLIVEAVKLVYDRMPDCGPELRLWASDAAVMCSNFGFDGITADMAITLRAE
jgi:hypothetical protein